MAVDVSHRREAFEKGSDEGSDEGLRRGLATRACDEGLRRGLATRACDEGLRRGLATRACDEGLRRGLATRACDEGVRRGRDGLRRGRATRACDEGLRRGLATRACDEGVRRGLATRACDEGPSRRRSHLSRLEDISLGSRPRVGARGRLTRFSHASRQDRARSQPDARRHHGPGRGHGDRHRCLPEDGRHGPGRREPRHGARRLGGGRAALARGRPDLCGARRDAPARGRGVSVPAPLLRRGRGVRLRLDAVLRGWQRLDRHSRNRVRDLPLRVRAARRCVGGVEVHTAGAGDPLAARREASGGGLGDRSVLRGQLPLRRLRREGAVDPDRAQARRDRRSRGRSVPVVADGELVASREPGRRRERGRSGRLRDGHAGGTLGLRWLEQHADGGWRGARSGPQHPVRAGRRHDRRDADLLPGEPGLLLSPCPSPRS